MFGRTVSGFGSYASRGEPDVSNVLIEDENGNDNCYTKVENSSGSNATTHNHALAGGVELVGGVSGGYTMTLKLNSSFTGNAASFAWSITEVDDPLNILFLFQLQVLVLLILMQYLLLRQVRLKDYPLLITLLHWL